MIKILLIDNNTNFPLQIKKYLSNEGFDVTVYNDSIKGVTEAKNNQYNMIILDIVNSNLNGFDVLKYLKQVTQSPIIILTERDEPFDRIYALELGAEDYLLKSIDRRELLVRIKVIIRRMNYSNDHTAKNKLNINKVILNRATREVYCEGHLLNFTSFQFEVLYFLMSNAGKIVSKESIGTSVFGRTVSYYDRSIDMHICNIRKKLSVHLDNTQIKTIRGVGYLFLEEYNYSGMPENVHAGEVMTP